MVKILYIAGYGRSGSTMLSAILGAHASVVGVGELTFGHDDWSDPQRRCSCGREYSACAFWGELLRREPRLLSARVAAEVRRVERLASPVWLGPAWVRRARRELYRDIQQRLFSLIVERSGKSVVVDASKSARLAAARTLALARLAGHEIYVLHLVRDGRATLASLLRTGSNWSLEGHVKPLPLPALRAVVGWTRSNLCASLLRACHGRERYLRMRYEDFLADPVASVRRIGAFVGTDMEPLVDRLRTGSTFPVGHVVGGNRVRFEGDITLRTATAERPAPRLTLAERLLFAAVGGWLSRLYGYAPHRDGRARARQGRPRPLAAAKPRVLVIGGCDVDQRIDLMRALSDRFSFAAAGSAPELEPAFSRAAMPFHFYPLRRGLSPLGDLRSFWRLARLVRQLRPEIVHTFDTKPSVWGRLAARLAGAPIVVGTLPGLGSLYTAARAGIVRRVYERLQRWSSAAADATVFQNRDDLRQFVAAGIVPERRASVIPGSGVRTDVLVPELVSSATRRRLRREWGAGADSVVVTMVSRVMRSKGVLDFAAAAEAVRREHPAAVFVLAGPLDRESLDRLSSDELERVRRSVHWIGARTDIPAVLRASDIFVLPSYYREGIPRVLLEAAAMALPLVTTRSPGCSAAVEHDRTGLLVPLKDPVALAVAVARLVADPGLRHRLGQAARVTACREFDLAVVAGRVGNLYDDLLQRGGYPPRQRTRAHAESRGAAPMPDPVGAGPTCNA